MSEQSIEIGIHTTADTGGVKKAETAIDSLATASTQAEKRLETVSLKSTAAGNSMGKMSTLANQASYQMGDFAVQVGGGTSAITAFAQQAPQLIGAFQMAGVLTGPMTLAFSAVAVLIPIIAFGGKAIAKAFGETAEPVEKVNERLAKIAKTINETKHERLDGMATALEDSAEAARQLAQEWPLTQKAEESYATATLTHLEKQLAIQRNIALAMGRQINSYKELEAAAKLAEDKRQLAAEQALAAEQKRLDEAKRKHAEAEAAQLRKFEDLVRHEARLKQLQQEIDVATAKQAAAKAVLAEPMPAASYGGGPGYDMWRDRRSQARTTRDDPALQRNLDENKRSLGEMRKDVETLFAELGKAETKTGVAANAVVDIAKAVSLKTDEILQGWSDGNLLAKTELVLAGQKQLVTDITANLDKITPQTAVAKAASDAIAAAAKEGDLITNHSLETANNLRTLMGSLQSGGATTNGNVQALIGIVSDLQNKAREQAGQIQTLQQRRH